MAKIFNSIKRPVQKKSAFDLSHDHKTTTNLGKITPILMQEVVPGDKFQINTEALLRCAPMVSPLMHRVNMKIEYFYVPYRLVWKNWQKFRTEEIEATIPKVSVDAEMAQSGTLPNFLGFPPIVGGSVEVSELPFRAYHKIWNDYYRDQNLQEEIDVEALTSQQIQDCHYRAWEKDYFTSCLPEAQKGDPVQVDVGGVGVLDMKKIATVYNEDGSLADNVAGLGTNTLGELSVQNQHADKLSMDNYEAQVPLQGEIDLNDIREANAMQRYRELLMRGGSRYKEFLRNFFGVNSSDGRLDRPEFLGGSKTPIMISEVLQTSENGETPQGNQSGHGLALGETGNKYKFFEEDGVLLGLLTILPVTNYMQGLDRIWSKTLPTDFYNPKFAHLGEQEVKENEIVCLPGSANETFGYQSRYAEYKYCSGKITGDFQTSGMQSFHMARKFGNVPNLNETFITTQAESGELMQRVFAAGDLTDPFWIQMYHRIKAVRPMPYYGTPKL